MATSQAGPFRDDVDAWLQQVFSRTFDPAYRDMARGLKQAYRRGGLPGVDLRYQAIMRELGQDRANLFRQAVERAAGAAGGAFLRDITQRYGRELVGTLLAPKPGSDIPRVLEELGQGAPRRVAQRILDMPNRNGYRYSDAIWRSDDQTRQEMRQFLQQHLEQGRSAIRDADAFKQYQAHDTNLPKHMRELERHAREALNQSPGSRERFLDAFRKAKHTIAERREGPLGTKAFQDRTATQMKRAVETGTAQTIDQAIDQFVDRRARYRSLVNLRSETNRAFQESSLETYLQYDFVLAVKWNLSRQHAARVGRDECDAKAVADVGLGNGIYYKQSVPWPDHANGLCYLTPELADPKDAARARPFDPPSGYEKVIAGLRGDGAIAKVANFVGRSALTYVTGKIVERVGIPAVLKVAERMTVPTFVQHFISQVMPAPVKVPVVLPLPRILQRLEFPNRELVPARRLTPLSILPPQRQALPLPITEFEEVEQFIARTPLDIDLFPRQGTSGIELEHLRSPFPVADVRKRGKSLAESLDLTQEDLTRGTRETIPLNKIIMDDKAGMSDRQVLYFMQNPALIEDATTPSILLRMPNGYYVVYDGHHRATAARMLGLPSIPANVIRIRQSFDPKIQNYLVQHIKETRSKMMVPPVKVPAVLQDIRQPLTYKSPAEMLKDIKKALAESVARFNKLLYAPVSPARNESLKEAEEEMKELKRIANTMERQVRIKPVPIARKAELLQQPYSQLEDTDEAKDYLGKLGTKLSVEDDEELPKELVNRISQTVHRIAQLNPLYVPKQIVTTKTALKKSTNGDYSHFLDRIRLNTTSKMFTSTKDATRDAKRGFNQRWYSSDDPNRTIIHELGHHAHFSHAPDKYRTLDLMQWTQRRQEIGRQVSRYASKDAFEFVAETFAALVNNRVFSKEVMDLYRQLGGPPVTRSVQSTVSDILASVALARACLWEIA